MPFLDDAWMKKNVAAVRDFFVHTPAEIYVLLSAGFIIGGAHGYNKGLEAEKNIPLAFSEYEKVERAYKEKGQPVPALTRFYSNVNDMSMKVFESSNIANDITGNNSTLAREFETRTDRAYRVYRQNAELVATINEDADAALLSVKKFTDAAQRLKPLMDALNAVWDEDHDDVYKEVPKYKEVCDEKGENCHEEQDGYESVYDHTDHSYDYHPQKAAIAARLLNDYLKKHPDLTIEEKLILATRLGAWNEYAIEKSHGISPGSRMTEEQLLEKANNWAHHSMLMVYSPEIYKNHADIKGLAAAFNASLKTAHDAYYETKSRSDDGPAEYQLANRLAANSETIIGATDKIVNGIEFARTGMPLLDQKMREFIAVTLDGKPGNSDKLRREVLQLSRDILKANFEGGIDTDPFKWGHVFLYALLGGAIGAGAGFLVDRYNPDSRGKNRFGNGPRF